MVSESRNGLRKELPDVDRSFYKYLVKHGDSSAALWIGRTRVDGEGVVYVPDVFTKKHVKDKYDGYIRKFLKFNGGDPRLSYVVDERLNGEGMSISIEELCEKKNVGGDCSGKGTVCDVESYVDLEEKKWKTFQRVLRESAYPNLRVDPIIHKGIEKAVSTFDILASDSEGDGKRYLLLGNRSAGKSTMLTYGINEFISKQLSVAYIDLNGLSEYIRMNFKKNEPAPIPSWVKVAEDADVLVIDELKGLCLRGGNNRPGTQGIVRNLLDRFHDAGKTVVMAYTGTGQEYDEMVGRLKSGKLDNYGNKGNCDLGSRLEAVTEVKVGSLGDSDRIDFVRKCLARVGLDYVEDIDSVAVGIHESLPVGASVRRISGAIDSVFHDARCDKGVVDYDRVLSVLGSGVGQRNMFGDYTYANQALESVGKNILVNTKVTLKDIQSRSRQREIVSFRDLFVHALCEAGQRVGDIARLLKKDSSTITASRKKTRNILDADPDELKANQVGLRRLIEDWEKR